MADQGTARYSRAQSGKARSARYSAEKTHHVLYFWKAGALRISNMILRGDYLVTTWWLLVDHLVTTWWLLVTTWWPLGDFSVTTWWPLGDYLVTTWRLLGDYLVTTWWLLGDHLVTTWWPLDDYLVTTWWLLGENFGDYLETTWWLLGDYLVTTWWPLGNHLETTWRPQSAVVHASVMPFLTSNILDFKFIWCNTYIDIYLTSNISSGFRFRGDICWPNVPNIRQGRGRKHWL